MKILHCLQSSTVIVLIWSNKYMQQFWQFLTINWFPLISPGALITVWSFRFSIRYWELSVGLLSHEYTFWGGSAEILESNSNLFILMCGSCHIWSFLIGVEYWNWRQTLDVYLLFAILLGQICQKLNYRFVTYKLASPYVRNM